MLQRRSKPEDDMPFRFAIATIAGCMLVGQAHADTPLQNQMQRVIELEKVDKWCTGAHEIDFDRLRGAIQTEREKAVAMASSEKVRIPTQSGQGFRFDVGHRSDLIPATIPK
jgi:hypothetical protein